MLGLPSSTLSFSNSDASSTPPSVVSRIDAFIACGGVMNKSTNVAAATLAQPVTLIAALRLNPANNTPPNVGPTINASVHDASRHAMSCGKNSGVEASARYAFTTGLAPANAPLSTRKSKNVSNDAPDRTHNPCKINPIPTPIKLNTMIGFRPTLSLNCGQKKSAPNIPSGYALVRYPTFSAATPNRRTRPGVIGPVTVNPSRCRNTASITHAMLSFCRHSIRAASGAARSLALASFARVLVLVLVLARAAPARRAPRSSARVTTPASASAARSLAFPRASSRRSPPSPSRARPSVARAPPVASLASSRRRRRRSEARGATRAIDRARHARRDVARAVANARRRARRRRASSSAAPSTLVDARRRMATMPTTTLSAPTRGARASGARERRARRRARARRRCTRTKPIALGRTLDGDALHRL